MFHHRRAHSVAHVRRVKGGASAHFAKVAAAHFPYKGFRVRCCGFAGLALKRRGGTVSLKTALFSAAAANSAVHQGDVTEFSGIRAEPFKQLSFRNYCAADACSQGEHEHAQKVFARAEVIFAKGGAIRVVGKKNRKTGLFLKNTGKVDISPEYVWRKKNGAFFAAAYAGNSHPDKGKIGNFHICALCAKADCECNLRDKPLCAGGVLYGNGRAADKRSVLADYSYADVCAAKVDCCRIFHNLNSCYSKKRFLWRCTCTLKSRPTPRYVIQTEVPPALKNGSVIPITGSALTHIPMLIRHCEKNMAKKP